MFRREKKMLPALADVEQFAAVAVVLASLALAVPLTVTVEAQHCTGSLSLHTARILMISGFNFDLRPLTM